MEKKFTNTVDKVLFAQESIPGQDDVIYAAHRLDTLIHRIKCDADQAAKQYLALVAGQFGMNSDPLNASEVRAVAANLERLTADQHSFFILVKVVFGNSKLIAFKAALRGE